MSNTAFRDVLFIALLLFVVMVRLMLPFLYEPAEADDAEPPGNLIVHITWEPGNNDVDLWLWGPGITKPVGYSNKNSRLWNLLRDDRGDVGDATGMNYENAYTRGVVAGEYVVNVHCYKCDGPQRVVMEMSLRAEDGDKGSLTVLGTATLEALDPTQERTLLRFRLGTDGTIVPGSTHRVFVPLRTLNQRPNLR